MEYKCEKCGKMDDLTVMEVCRLDNKLYHIDCITEKCDFCECCYLSSEWQGTIYDIESMPFLPIGGGINNEY